VRAAVKYQQRYFKPEGWNFKTNFLAGTEWTVMGSRNTVYTVALTDQGFTCECQGFQYHGKCKHSRAVAEKFDV